MICHCTEVHTSEIFVLGDHTMLWSRASHGVSSQEGKKTKVGEEIPFVSSSNAQYMSVFICGFYYPLLTFIYFFPLCRSLLYWLCCHCHQSHSGSGERVIQYVKCWTNPHKHLSVRFLVGRKKDSTIVITIFSMDITALLKVNIGSKCIIVLSKYWKPSV